MLGILTAINGISFFVAGWIFAPVGIELPLGLATRRTWRHAPEKADDTRATTWLSL
jgi:hypothetical protein